jgi:hypothetical protein
MNGDNRARVLQSKLALGVLLPGDRRTDPHGSEGKGRTAGALVDRDEDALRDAGELDIRRNGAL